MKCTSPRNSFCAVESTTDEQGQGNEQTEAETAASEEVSWPRQLGAQRSRVLGRGLRELGAPLLGRVKEVVVVHVQGREDSRRQGYCA
jgi:hypothetical protein